MIELEQGVQKVGGDGHAALLHHGDKDDHLVIGGIQGQDDFDVLEMSAGEVNDPDSGRFSGMEVVVVGLHEADHLGSAFFAGLGCHGQRNREQKGGEKAKASKRESAASRHKKSLLGEQQDCVRVPLGE